MTFADWMFECILPTYLILVGAVHLARPPRFGSFWAYHGDFAKKNQETWAYAQKLMGQAFLFLGLVSAVVVLLTHSLFPAIRAFHLLSLPIALFLILIAPYINHRLKRKFPDLLSGKHR